MAATKGTSKVCTADQKRLCHSLAALFELHADIMQLKGDETSERAWKYVASIIRDVQTNGPKYLEELLDKRTAELARRSEENV